MTIVVLAYCLSANTQMQKYTCHRRFKLKKLQLPIPREETSTVLVDLNTTRRKATKIEVLSSEDISNNRMKIFTSKQWLDLTICEMKVT